VPYPSKQRQCSGGGGKHALMDYHMKLQLLEQQNKQYLMLARQEQELMEAAQQNQAGKNEAEHKREDYERQLMLLGLQNKKHLMMERQRQEDMQDRKKQHHAA